MNKTSENVAYYDSLWLNLDVYPWSNAVYNY